MTFVDALVVAAIFLLVLQIDGVLAAFDINANSILHWWRHWRRLESEEGAVMRLRNKGWKVKDVAYFTRIFDVEGRSFMHTYSTARDPKDRLLLLEMELPAKDGDIDVLSLGMPLAQAAAVGLYPDHESLRDASKAREAELRGSVSPHG